jgi:hypothetical protein
MILLWAWYYCFCSFVSEFAAVTVAAWHIHGAPTTKPPSIHRHFQFDRRSGWSLQQYDERSILSMSFEGFSQAKNHVNGEVFSSPKNGEYMKQASDVAVLSESNDVGRNLSMNDSIFNFVASSVAVCLYQSDIRRDAIGKAAGKQASSATNWINDASALALQNALDQLCLQPPSNDLPTDAYSNKERDNAIQSIRWFKSVPCPAILDLSSELQSAINATLTDTALQEIAQSRHDFLSRVGCRVLLLPSGAALTSPLTEPPASVVYGKLLYGGVTRYRQLGGTSQSSLLPTVSRQQQRRAGVRTEVKPTVADVVPTWMMYGGPNRMYESVDMGAAAILEVLLLPRGQCMERSVHTGKTMLASGIAWTPQSMFKFVQKTPPEGSVTTSDPWMTGHVSLLSGKDRNEAFRTEFQSVVGGLQPQIDAIVRRVLDGRVIRPVVDDVPDDDIRFESRPELTTSLEAEELKLLGLTPVRGLLLYGPPGCGKFD